MTSEGQRVILPSLFKGLTWKLSFFLNFSSSNPRLYLWIYAEPVTVWMWDCAPLRRGLRWCMCHTELGSNVFTAIFNFSCPENKITITHNKSMQHQKTTWLAHVHAGTHTRPVRGIFHCTVAHLKVMPPPPPPSSSSPGIYIPQYCSIMDTHTDACPYT